MSEIKLLRCPFCGGDNLGMWHNHLFSEGYEVRCYDCHFGLEQKTTKEEAVAAWNNRKPVEDVLERLEKKIRPLHNVNWNAAMEEAIEIIKEELM